MSTSKGFCHQAYDTDPKPGQYEFVERKNLVRPGSHEFKASMERVGEAFRANDVSRIILVHGTMAGTDALGWYSHWHRIAPGLSKQLKSAYKSVVDKFTSDKGNFTKEYEDVLRSSLNSNVENSTDDLSKPIEVEQFLWTSENHHLGRADAAVRLTNYLLDLENGGEKNILLIGHSHGANVFALVTQLLANPLAVNKNFFDAGRHFHQSTGRIDLAGWKSLEVELSKRKESFQTDESNSQAKTKLSFVTYGAPIRYGWNSCGYENLLHFVNHLVPDNLDFDSDQPLVDQRNHSKSQIRRSRQDVSEKSQVAAVDGEENSDLLANGSRPYQAYIPRSTRDFIAAMKGEYGDFVQHCFIAQTDFPPAIWSWSAWKANRLLRQLLEASELKNKRLWRFQQGKRVAESGTTLLIDYLDTDPTARDFAGHSVYTELDSMEFQMREIATRFFGALY